MPSIGYVGVSTLFHLRYDPILDLILGRGEAGLVGGGVSMGPQEIPLGAKIDVPYAESSSRTPPKESPKPYAQFPSFRRPKSFRRKVFGD
jgi:hypothetical protein